MSTQHYESLLYPYDDLRLEFVVEIYKYEGVGKFVQHIQLRNDPMKSDKCYNGHNYVLKGVGEQRLRSN